jgi:large subunit ribosomal protein L31
MKKDIHPKYFKDAIIHCSCGKVFKIGSTRQEMHVEVCSACHPFYTGQDKIIDTAGRVEKFRKRLAQKKQPTTKKKPVSAKASDLSADKSAGEEK